MRLALSTLVLSLSFLAVGAETLSLKDRAYDFVEKNMAGRKQKTAIEGTIAADGENYLVAFEAEISWGKPEKTEEGIVFTETRVIKQNNTKLTKDGKPTTEVFNSDRTVVHRHALAERKTSNSLVGLTTVVSNTLEDPTGKGFITMLEMSADGKEIYLYESMAAFVEAAPEGKEVIPVASASESTLFLDKAGKLQTNQTLKFYKVDVNRNFDRKEIYRFNLSASEAK